VVEVLNVNFKEKHIRGGLDTKQKYLNERKLKEYNKFDYCDK
jgi:hypothetical protein